MMRLSAAVLFCLLSLHAGAANVFLWWRDGDTGNFERVVLDVIPEYVLGFDASGVPEMVEAGGGGGSGDVVGPASAVTGRIALFDGITGKLLSDSGSTIATVQARANHTGTQLLSTISDAGTLAGLSAVTTTQITDGTIANEDISGSAAIALSKLATDPLARANHTGTQAAGTITGLATSATTDTTSASNISSGTLGDERLSANVPLIDAVNDWSAQNIFGANGAASTPALKLDGTIFTGGTGTTTKPMFLIEQAGTTSTGWTTSGTMIGVNAPSGFAGRVISGQVNGTEVFSVSQTGSTVIGGNFSSTSGNASLTSAAATFNVGGNTILGSDGAAAWQSGADSATPITQTFKGPDARAGTDTNTAGGILNIAAGRGTGTAAGGVLNLQTSEPTSSGTAAGTLTTRLAISGTALTASKPVILPSYTVATLPAGTVGMTAYVTDATAPTYLGTLTGGGAVTCPVFYNGAAWVSH